MSKLCEGHLYAVRVINNEIVAGELVRLACARYLADLEQSPENGLFFEEQAAARAISFIEKLRHTKGEWAGERFKLQAWQKFIVRNLFGWKRADGSRRYRKAYVEISRKNGKTSFAAAIGLYMLYADNENRAEVYSAATTAKQAKICFDEATAAVRATTLQDRILVQANSLVYMERGSKFSPVSSEYKSLDGLNPSCAIIDEYHAHRDSGVYDVLVSGMGARRQPLTFIITTAGNDKFSACFEHRIMCVKLLKGVLQDPATFVFIASLDDESEWDKPEMWIKSNPNLGVSVKAEYIEERVLAAKNKPSEIVDTKTKNLNLWVDAMKGWIADDRWVACHDENFDERVLLGRECYGGLDLSNVSDLTAFALLFEINGRLVVKVWAWIPHETMNDRFSRENINYPHWVAEGWIRCTEGNVIDRAFVEADILELSKIYRIKSIAYDRYDSTATVIRFQDEGLKLSKFGQGYASMSTPTKRLEEIVLSGQLEHLGNPALRWQMSNIELSRDPAGNIKPNKAAARQKIDGVVALIMALGEKMTVEGVRHVYSGRGLREL